MMIIDSHEHVILPTSEQLKQMDAAGVAKTVLFSTKPHPEKAKNLQELEDELNTLYATLSGRQDLKETCKDTVTKTKELCGILEANPNRFLGFGLLPISLSYKETCLWIENYIVKNGLLGVGEFSAAGQTELLETVFEGISNYNNLPIWVHTFSPVTKTDIFKLTALCEKYPKIPVIFGHLGGTNWMDVIKLAKDHANIYLDLSAVFTTMALKYAMFELPERTLFSSDAPYGNPELSRIMVEKMSPSDEVTETVLGRNIERLLNLKSL
jgi:uncharacterized protein